MGERPGQRLSGSCRQVLIESRSLGGVQFRELSTFKRGHAIEWSAPDFDLLVGCRCRPSGNRVIDELAIRVVGDDRRFEAAVIELAWRRWA